MNSIFEELVQEQNIRENLIALREQLKQEEGQKELSRLVEQQGNPFVGFLGHEDPKVRRNAALILGEMGCQQEISGLFEQYWREETLFVRADYLKAIQKLDYSEYEDRLKQRLSELSGQEVSQENQKHVQQEITVLRQMLQKQKPLEVHPFVGKKQRFDMVLTTNRNHREVTARQIREGKVALVPMGVKVSKGIPETLSTIRTYRELLFELEVRVVGPDPIEAARTLAASDLSQVVERALGHVDCCCFRITIIGKMTLEHRSTFSKRCGFELEQRTGGRFQNAPGGYELELRLYQRKDGTFLPLLKFSGFQDKRFTYRREVLATSMHPSLAALMMELARPYLRKNSQVLDPFCGVGTLLIERSKVMPVGNMYGVDIFGEAIAGAKENTGRTSCKINYIQRDFMEFTHGYLFDEILTDMPVRGKRTKEEQDALYDGFFRKAQELLSPQGVMVLYSNERGFIKKQLRLHEELRLLHEFGINDKDDAAIYIIGR